MVDVATFGVSLSAQEALVVLWTALLHFSWQAILLAIAIGVARRCMGRLSARSRYAVCCSAVLALPCLFVGTLCYLAQSRTVLEPPVALAGPSSDASPANAIVDAVSESETGDQLASSHASEFEFNPNEHAIHDTKVSTDWLQRLTLPFSAAYALVVMLMLLRVAHSVLAGRRMRRMGLPVVDSKHASLITDAARQMGLSKLPQVLMSDFVSVPTVVGILKPLVLIPCHLMSGLSETELRAILCHEFAHIRRYDAIVNLLQRIIEAVFFYHPAVWLLSNWTSSEREACCDDLAVRGGCHRLHYADAMLRMAERCSTRRHRVPGLAATGRKSNELEQRILRLIDTNYSPSNELRVGSLSLTGIAAALLLASPAIAWQVGKEAKTDPIENQPLPAPQGSKTRDERAAQLEALKQLNLDKIRNLDKETQTRIEMFETAFRLQTAIGAQQPTPFPQPYQAGLDALKRAGQKRGKVRLEHAKDAGAFIQQFIQKYPDHRLIMQARTKLAEANWTAATGAIEMARELGTSTEQASKHYESAENRLAMARDGYTEILKDLTKQFGETAKKDAKARAKTAQTLSQVMLYRARLGFVEAQIHQADPMKRREVLSKAAKDFHDIYQKYRSRALGLAARIEEARCYALMHNRQRAIGMLKELIAVASSSKALESLRKEAQSLLDKLEEVSGDTSFEWLERVGKQRRGGLIEGRHYIKNAAGQIVELNLIRLKLQPLDYKEIINFRQLKKLTLTYSNVTDEDLRNLIACKKLEHLSVFGTSVTDAGLRWLAQVSALTTLDVGDTKVTDAGVQQLVKMESLYYLGLERCEITDKGVESLLALKELQTLKLSETPVSDAAISKLLSLPKLGALTLGETKVTQKGMKQLAADPRFQWVVSDQATITEFAKRMERGDFQAANDMLAIGLDVPDHGNYTFKQIGGIPQSEKDKKRGRNRYRLELDWIVRTKADLFFSVLSVDRGCITLHSMGIE